jgi:four helix bundle protein
VAFRRLEDIRAWQFARQFKISVYRLTDAMPLARDLRLRDQLREAAASAAGNISEGFGRFDPADFARFVKIARASLVECKNHLIDALDRGHIDEQTLQAHAALADDALKEAAGLLDYLQSPEAKRNAERIRQSRIERRRGRRPEP